MRNCFSVTHYFKSSNCLFPSCWVKFQHPAGAVWVHAFASASVQAPVWPPDGFPPVHLRLLENQGTVVPACGALPMQQLDDRIIYKLQVVSKKIFLSSNKIWTPLSRLGIETVLILRNSCVIPDVCRTIESSDRAAAFNPPKHVCDASNFRTVADITQVRRTPPPPSKHQTHAHRFTQERLIL
jgi:hypothetical protein